MLQTVDAVPSLPSIDDPVPQMVEQLPDIMYFFDTLMPDPEQVIEVPKILPDDVPVRTAVRDTQLAEQLVEVPTIVSFSLLQRNMEQNVDIPVLGHGGRHAGLQFFPLEQSSTAPSAQIVDIPVSGGGLQGFRPGQGSSSSHSPAGRHAGRWRMAGCLAGGCGQTAAMSVLRPRRFSRRLTTCDVVPSRPSLCNDRSRRGAWVMAEPGYIIKCQSTEAFGRNSYPGFALAFRTWKYGTLFLYVLASGGRYLDV